MCVDGCGGGGQGAYISNNPAIHPPQLRRRDTIAQTKATHNSQKPQISQYEQPQANYSLRSRFGMGIARSILRALYLPSYRAPTHGRSPSSLRSLASNTSSSSSNSASSKKNHTNHSIPTAVSQPSKTPIPASQSSR